MFLGRSNADDSKSVNEKGLTKVTAPQAKLIVLTTCKSGIHILHPVALRWVWCFLLVNSVRLVE